MKSFDRGLVRRIPYTNRLVATIRLLGEYKGKEGLYAQQTPQVLETLRRAAVIESTESSNRIEGIAIPPRKRLESLIAGTTTPGNRSEAEIAGYRDVLNTIHGSHQAFDIALRGSRGRIAFTPIVVLQLHRDLLQSAGGPGAGRWKSADNDITETRP